MAESASQDSIIQALEADEPARARALIGALHPSEVADLIESMPAHDRAGVWALVDPSMESDVLSDLHASVRAGLLETMHPHRVAAITAAMDTDDVADLLQELPREAGDTVLLAMDRRNRERLASVLAFPENTAGGLMNTDVVAVRADVTLDVVSTYLRKLGRLPEHTDSLMVVDRDNGYLGVLPLADLITGEPDSSVSAHIVTEAGIAALTPAQEVARLFEQHDLISAAVIDEGGRLLGRITVDDVVDVIQEQAEHTLRSMAGLGDDETFAPVLTSTRRRALWLGINLLTAFLASWVIGRFEATIQQLVALAVLMPIVASMGGIAGGQTLTIAIRALATGQISRANVRWLMAKEMLVGLFNGCIFAAVVAAVATLWFEQVSLGVIIGVAMMINLLVAALAGALIPLSLKRLGVDPAIAGGVLLTTVTDVVGFMTFLGLATLFLLPR